MVGTIQCADGRSHVGHLTCPDRAAFRQQTQEMIQGPSMPGPYPILCFFPHITLPFWGRWSFPEIAQAVSSAVQQSVWGTYTSLQTRIFCPQETAFRCTGENEAFWVNTTWLNCTLFEKKLMAFVWLWARPDFLHFYLGLLVISHVTTILLQYCAWRWRQGEIYFKTGKYVNTTAS